MAKAVGMGVKPPETDEEKKLDKLKKENEALKKENKALKKENDALKEAAKEQQGTQ